MHSLAIAGSRGFGQCIPFACFRRVGCTGLALLQRPSPLCASIPSFSVLLDALLVGGDFFSASILSVSAGLDALSCHRWLAGLWPVHPFCPFPAGWMHWPGSASTALSALCIHSVFFSPFGCTGLLLENSSASASKKNRRPLGPLSLSTYPQHWQDSLPAS